MGGERGKALRGPGRPRTGRKAAWAAHSGNPPVEGQSVLLWAALSVSLGSRGRSASLQLPMYTPSSELKEQVSLSLFCFLWKGEEGRTASVLWFAHSSAHSRELLCSALRASLLCFPTRLISAKKFSSRVGQSENPRVLR